MFVIRVVMSFQNLIRDNIPILIFVFVLEDCIYSKLNAMGLTI
jgi:hypothetical protein